jgi:DNA-binding MarR family transcriptional regulator
VKAACLASSVPKTTALRCLARLYQLGLVARLPHPTDHRSSHIELTGPGLEAMRAFLERVR